jgi:hypothetical protein
LELAVASDDKRDAAAVFRHCGRLEERSVGTFPDFQDLPVLKPPQPVAGSAGGQEEQRRASKAWRQRTGGRQWKRVSIALKSDAIENGNAEGAALGAAGVRFVVDDADEPGPGAPLPGAVVVVDQPGLTVYRLPG